MPRCSRCQMASSAFSVCTPPASTNIGKISGGISNRITNPRATSEEKSGPRKSAATELVELAEEFAFFHDRQDRPFVRLEKDGHTEIWPVESTKFRKLLARTYYKKMKKAINRNAIADAITTLAGKACHDGKRNRCFCASRRTARTF